MTNISMPRTITIHLSDIEQDQLEDRVGAQAVQAAIGYLGLWNMNNPAVDIYLDGESDLRAEYRGPGEITPYSIKAAWNGADYDFPANWN